MPSHTWSLAVAELVFFIPSAIPTLYCAWAYRRTALVGWIFIVAFVLLNLIGSGLIVSAGKEGQPSTTAIILISVGLSPLLVGIAGLIHGWAKAIGFYKSKTTEKLATSVMLVYHIAVIAAIAIYATGQTQASKPNTNATGQTMAEAGILLLLLLLLIMDAAFIVIMIKGGTRPLRPLLFAIAISLLLLKVRLVYQTISVFLDYETKFNPVTGSIALRVLFQFLPGALILLALVTGGVLSARKQKEVHGGVQNDIPLRTQSVAKGSV